MCHWKLELHKALELADELLAAAEDAKDPAMLLIGNQARGTTLLGLGELVSANEHLEKALAVFDLRQLLSAELEIWRLSSFDTLYFGLYGLGYPDRAWAKSREMLEVGQRSSNSNVLVHVSGFGPHITCYVAIARPRRSTPKRRWRSPKS